ncbi:MAG: SDR family oxidoreductase [Elusimicrobiota bacterium]|mgnify:CR=1 FL=1
MKTLVTGGAGFIGSHLVERLINDGHDVTVVDNLCTGRPENLHPMKDSPRLKVLQKDIGKDDLNDAFKGIDWVFHLAALADIVPSIDRPQDYHHANVVGTFRVLEAAKAAQVKRFVYTASSSCYGLPDKFPTPETAAIRPQYPYALTKWLGEQYVMHWAQVYKLPAVSLRLFNVYGPRSRTSGAYGAVFGVFLAQKINGKPFTVVGDGEQTRDFTFVTDVAAAFAAAAASDAICEVFNVGSGGTHSVNRIVELLGGAKTHIPKRPGEPDCTFADIGKITKNLLWKPTVSIEQGVATMLKNIDHWKQAPVWTPDSIQKATEKWFAYLSK